MEKDSLVWLAAEGILPEIQHMDTPTWRWIRANDPHYTMDSPELGPFDWFRVLPLKSAWLAEKELVDSLHGLRHFWRTAYFALRLAEVLKLNETEARWAVVASLLHDIRRLNDKADHGHAQRSAVWFRKHAAQIGSAWGIDLTTTAIDTIATAISLHETPYTSFSPAQKTAYAKCPLITDVVKTADALDRYRLPKITWWPDDSHLRLTPPEWLRQHAFEIVLASEGRFLQTSNSLESLQHAFELGKGTPHNKQKVWEKAHPSSSVRRRKPGSTPVQDWHAMYRDAPQAHLLKSNSFFEVASRPVAHLLHVTTDVDAVIERGALFSSRGCMVGTVYCTPLFPDKDGLRAHNLGDYIYTREAGRSLLAQGVKGRKPAALIIDVQLPPGTPKEMTGVNYLHLGDAHLQTFTLLHYLLPTKDIGHLQQSIGKRIQAASTFLRMCHEVAVGQASTVDAQDFFRLATVSIQHLPILGYFYFEAITESIMLLSTDKRSQLLAEKGEFNAWSHKELAFNAWPALLQNFNLGGFRPSFTTITARLERMNEEGTIRVDIPVFLAHVQRRFSFLVDHCLLADSPEALRATEEARFEELATLASPLLGHAIDREIRQHSRYSDFRAAFDIYEADQIWNYWKNCDLYLPFNGIIPKGEIGINPRINPGHITIREAEPYYEGGDLFFVPGQALNVRVVPELVRPALAFMGLKG